MGSVGFLAAQDTHSTSGAGDNGRQGTRGGVHAENTVVPAALLGCGLPLAVTSCGRVLPRHTRRHGGRRDQAQHDDCGCSLYMLWASCHPPCCCTIALQFTFPAPSRSPSRRGLPRQHDLSTVTVGLLLRHERRRRGRVQHHPTHDDQPGGQAALHQKQGTHAHAHTRVDR